MNILVSLFNDLSQRLIIDENKELTDIDAVFYSEIQDLVEIPSVSPFDVYNELTYIFVRYTGTNVPYKHISPFIEDVTDNPVLYIIFYLRSYAACNILDFYEQVTFESQHIINISIKNKAVTTSNLLSIINASQFKEQPDQKLVQMEMSLCEVSEYMSYVIKFVKNSPFIPKDLEYLIAVSFYFGYINKEDNSKWEECSELIIKVFNGYTNDSLRRDSFLNMNGIKLYELFKMNEMILRKFIRDISLWIQAGYRYRLDTMEREWADIQESIEREEYSYKNLSKCQENITESRCIYSSYKFLPWNVNSLNIKQATRVITSYTWAEHKIKNLKDN
jgi:hypothetical protein